MSSSIARTTAIALALGALGFVAGPAGAQSSAPAQAAAPRPATAGRIERITVPGPSLAGNLAGDAADRKVSVYLPPSYGREPQRRYPVLYLLHGFTDSDSRWFGLQGQHFVNLPRAADRAFGGDVAEMIIVMPDAFTKYHGSMYSSSVVTGDWEAFVAEDLVKHIDAHYRTLARPASRGLGGHSMGGYGAMRIGMKHPQVFSTLYAMSPCCMRANLAPGAELMQRAAKVTTAEEIAASDFATRAMLASAAAWSPNPQNPPHYFDLPVADGKPVPAVIAAWAANAPLAMVHQYIPALKGFAGIAVDSGDKDFGIVDTVRDLHGILTAYGIEHFAEVYDGDHVNRIEQRLHEKVLPFFAQHLKFE